MQITQEQGGALEAESAVPSRKGAEESEEEVPGTLRDYFTTTVVCAIFALFVTTWVVHPMTVPTPSMEPTILVGDRLLIDKFTLRNGFEPGLSLTPVHHVRRGDILVFKFPEDPKVLYVKRAIGLPGDRLEIKDKAVYINGSAIQEPYKVHSDPFIYPRHGRFHRFDSSFRRDNFGPVTVPGGSYFMMGDNRDDSADSRYFGFLPGDYIVGRPLFVFWSYEDDADAYLKSSLPELMKLYTQRVLFFFTRTRWARTGHLIR